MSRLTRGMQVTRANFSRSLDTVREAINDADLLAFDTELTGLMTSEYRSDYLDSVPARYSKLLKGSEPFIVTQFGLCAFKWCADSSRYVAKPFNFFTFPTSLRGVRRDDFFTCQSSSIEFLCANNFDFNKVFREGISYLRPAEEKIFRENYAKSTATVTASAAIEVPAEQKDYIDNIVEKFTTFQNGESGIMLDIPPCNGFQRKLIFQLKEQFPGLHLQSEKNEKGERFIRCVRLVGEPSAAADKLRREKEKEAVENATGVSLVFRAMLESGKLIVGHNMMLDVIHCLRQFHCELPEDFTEFQKVVVNSMPRLIDSKMVARSAKFQTVIDKTHLGNVYSTAKSERFPHPAICVADNVMQTEQAHDAAYDAYMTGFSLLRMMSDLNEDDQGGPVDLASAHVNSLLHKVNMLRTLDLPFMDLARPNVTPRRPHILQMSFPKDWDFKSIIAFFTKSGVETPSQVSWISDCSAYVMFAPGRSVEQVISTLADAAASENVEMVPVDAPPSAKEPTQPQPKKRKSSTFSDLPNSENKRPCPESVAV